MRLTTGCLEKTHSPKEQDKIKQLPASTNKGSHVRVKNSYSGTIIKAEELSRKYIVFVTAET